MKEFTKVSVHNHFGGVGADRLIDQSYDKIFNFDFNDAINKIDSAFEYDFKLLVMTQSNVFNLSSYTITRYYARKKGINILPGVEINLKNSNGKYLHVVVIFDEKNDLYQIGECISKYTFKNQENCLNLEQFLSLIVEFKCIIVPHGLKQKDRSSVANPELLSELISLSNSIPVVLEDGQSYHKQQLKMKIKDKLSEKEYFWIDKTAVVSAADRKDFSKITSPTFIWGSATFDDLYYSCFMGETRIKRQNDLVQKINYISKIEVISSKNTQINPVIINCSHGLNTIIGPSGSGKTLLLDVIKRKLTGVGLVNKTISSNSDYSKLYNIEDINLYDRNNELIELDSGYSVVEGEILYNKVISAYLADKNKMLKELNIEINQSPFRNVIDKFNKEINEYRDIVLRINKNKLEIKQLILNVISTVSFLNENNVSSHRSISYFKKEQINTDISIKTQNLSEVENDLKNIDRAFSIIFDISRKYGFEKQFSNDIGLIIQKIINTLKKKKYHEFIEYNTLIQKNVKQNFIFDIVQQYNKKIGQQSALVVSRNQELLKLFQNIQDLLYDNVLLNRKINIPTLDNHLIKEAIKIKDSENARLSINKVKLNFTLDEIKNYYSSNIGNMPKVNKTKFKITDVNFENKESVEMFLNTFINENYTDRLNFSINLEDMIDYKIELKNIENIFEDINSISAGNLGKIYINRMFEDKIESAGSNVIVVYDQPDSNMEKAFILNELAPRLSSLRDKYQVFISTHEPLLVVNADSNNIIAAINEKTAIKSNDIKYVNRSFAGTDSKASLIYEVAKLIDGHPDAIKMRNTIYGGLLNENRNK